MKTPSLMNSIQEVTKETYKGEIHNHTNPMPELIGQGKITQVGNGLFVLADELVLLLDVIERLFLNIAKKRFARLLHVPTFLSEENLTKSNYLESFSHQAFRLKGDQNQYLGLACPTVCYHYFSSLSNKVVNSPQLITAVGRCSRNETGELKDLSRLTNFTMREIVVLDTKQNCRSIMADFKESITKCLVESLKLQFKITTASDPFFGRQNEIKKKAQLLSESKFEIRADLPFSGETVGISSLNFHQNVFYERFDIGTTLQEPESACIGFGYERILFAILAQKGTDFSTEYYRALLSRQDLQW